jgi:hypothetical protein
MLEVDFETLDLIRQQRMLKLKFELLPHPAHSLDPTPFDYRIFGLIKNALRGRRFSNDDEVKDMLHTWLRGQLRTFFADGIRKLVDQGNECVEKLVDYVEK